MRWYSRSESQGIHYPLKQFYENASGIQCIVAKSYYCQDIRLYIDSAGKFKIPKTEQQLNAFVQKSR